MTLRKLLPLLPLVLLAGCTLDTRSQTKTEDERTVMRKQVQSLQATTADVNSRFADVEEDVRKANGRLDVIEQKMSQQQAEAKSKGDARFAQADAKLADTDKAYREEFTKLHSEIDTLRAEIEAQKAAQASAAASSSAAEKKDPFEAAEEKFDNKDYKGAILDYQAYRSKSPHGKHVAAATYKMGASFQEMGMVDQARSFYESVTSDYPKSPEASKSKAKLKAMKKK